MLRMLTPNDTLRREAFGALRALVPAETSSLLADAARTPALSIERAVIAPVALLGYPVESAATEALLVGPLAVEGLFWQRVADRTGQSRAVYAPLLLTAALWMHAAFPPARRPLLHARVAELAADTHDLPPSLALWRAWTLFLAAQVFHEPAWTPQALTLATGALAAQAPAGHLHPLTPDTNLDAFVYDELTALHAAGQMARFPAGEALVAPVGAMARYHVDNTQPDNTTQEPWAVATFASFPDTAPMAAQQLHDVRSRVAHHPAQLATGVMLALLADAARPNV